MLSKKDLLYNSDNVQPLGSRKGVLNKPSNLVVDVAALFISSKNTNTLLNNLTDVYRQNGGKACQSKFNYVIELLIKKFISERNLYSYCTVEWQSTGYNNYYEALMAINDDFTKYVYNYFQWNIYNPYKDLIEVGPNDNRRKISSAQIQYEDFGTLDVWRKEQTTVFNRQFRDNNKIPAYRTSLHSRNYDRHNIEGLTHGDSDRASLEAPIYGYDMSNIHADITNYKEEGWFSM